MALARGAYDMLHPKKDQPVQSNQSTGQEHEPLLITVSPLFPSTFTDLRPPLLTIALASALSPRL